jgi:UrcA family protein
MNLLAPLPVLIACSLAASVLAPVAGTASAANAPDVAVHYADLDLGNRSDVERLYTRLQAAADTVCTSAQPYELARFAAHQRCVQAVLERSVSQVRSPALLALHRATAAGHHRAAAHS